MSYHQSLNTTSMGLGCYNVFPQGVLTDVCVPISKLTDIILAMKEDLDQSTIIGMMKLMCVCGKRLQILNLVMLFIPGRTNHRSCGRRKFPHSSSS